MKRRRVGLRYGVPRAARKWVNGTGALELSRVQFELYCNLGIDTSLVLWRERQFQASVVAYLDKKYPQVGSLCFHVPLELLRRHDKSAAMFHSLGARAGVADLVMLIPRGAYHGFVLELKVPPNRPTEAQCRFLASARGMGYAACWTDTATTAYALIDAYLRLPERALLAELQPRRIEEVPDEFRRPRQKRQANRPRSPAVKPADDARTVADGTTTARLAR